MRIPHGHACVGVAEPIYPGSHWHVLSVHHGFVAVAEAMKTASPNVQLLQKRIKFSPSHHVGISRSAVLLDTRKLDSSDIKDPFRVTYRVLRIPNNNNTFPNIVFKPFIFNTAQQPDGSCSIFHQFDCERTVLRPQSSLRPE
jgi:hypothetical protein